MLILHTVFTIKINCILTVKHFFVLNMNNMVRIQT